MYLLLAWDFTFRSNSVQNLCFFNPRDGTQVPQVILMSDQGGAGPA